MMQRILPSLRRAIAPATAKRSYATNANPNGSNTAPIYLGLGLVGAGLFYYSTLEPKDDDDEDEKVVEKKVKISKDAPAALSNDEFRNFKLSQIIPFNHNTSRFVFDLPEGTQSGLTVASALVVKSATEGLALAKNGKPAVRPYTPVTAPGVEGKLELLVKKYPGGVMTEHIHSLKEGDELSIKGPIPKFAYKANQFDSITLIAGGSGITPMWQIMQAIDSDPTDKTKATLVFGNVTEADILLRKEFDDLSARKPTQFKVHHVLDQPPKTWSGPTGFINASILKDVMSPASLGEKTMVFVCGPPGQVEAVCGAKKSFKDQGEVRGVLKELGFKEEQVYKF